MTRLLLLAAVVALAVVQGVESPPAPTVADTDSFTVVTNAAVVAPHRNFGDARIENASNTLARAMTLAWEGGDTNGIEGYVLHWGLTNSLSTNHLNIGLNQMVAFYGLDTNEVHFFYVSGYDTNGVETTNNWKLTMKPIR